MKDGQPQRSNERLFMQFLAFGGCADAAAAGRRARRARRSPACCTRTSTIRAASALLTFSEDPDYFVDRVRPLLNEPPFAALVAEARVHDARPHLLDRLRAGSAGGAAAPAAAHGAQPGVAVGGVVSAAPQRQVRAAAAGRAARDPRRARHDRHVVRRRRLRARHPPRLPRPRHATTTTSSSA